MAGKPPHGELTNKGVSISAGPDHYTGMPAGKYVQPMSLAHSSPPLGYQAGSSAQLYGLMNSSLSGDRDKSTLPPGLDVPSTHMPVPKANMMDPKLGYGMPGSGSLDDSSKSQDKKTIDQSRRFTGRLKFFDENKSYGFIVCEDDDKSEIFVHLDDLERANLPKDLLRTAKKGNTIRLSFSLYYYVGRHKNSKKAVDLKLLPN